MKNKLILSCEHASNAIPKEYTNLFSPHSELIQSHFGHDIGAELLFEAVEKQINADYSIKGLYSRLLIELNRSLHHNHLFSSITKPLDASVKDKIIQYYYTPYRESIEGQIQNYIQKGKGVIHLSIHSFTPLLNGKERTTDIGLLYNPSSSSEKALCKAWKLNLKAHFPNLVIRLNYPYLGKSDGLTTYLRKQFPENYSGIELEIKNDLIETPNWSLIEQGLIKSFKKSLPLMDKTITL